jgi:hypothetical protein
MGGEFHGHPVQHSPKGGKMGKKINILIKKL